MKTPTMEETINATNSLPSKGRNISTAAQIITAFLLVTSVWAFLSFLIFGVRKGAWQKKKSRTSFVLMSLATAAPAFAFVRVVSTQILLIIGNQELFELSAGNCYTVYSLNVISYTLAILCVYAYLWYRQRTLYSKPSLRHLNTRLINFISAMVMPLIAVGVISICVMFHMTEHIALPNIGCTFKFITSLGAKPLYALVTLTSLMQLVLFLLFLYPLRNFSSTPPSDFPKKKTYTRLRRIIKLASTSLILCILSDLIVSGVARSLQILLKTNTMLSTAVYDINLVVNVVSIMGSFENNTLIASSLFCGSRLTTQDLQSTASSKRKNTHSTTNL